MNFLMFKLVLKRQRNQRPNCQHLLDHGESKRVPENIYFCSIDYDKAFGIGMKTDLFQSCGHC